MYSETNESELKGTELFLHFKTVAIDIKNLGKKSASRYSTSVTYNIPVLKFEVNLTRGHVG